ncbi:hypothetical protein L4X63_03110 [Geomonas sp. Red32]|uniref:dTMP kinase n=1 Tax=Geomonas sp. Red32 TaxID=2912856 RepID=UPI00202CF2A7|nr:hypothetical protein [Geomonas sp. Red32]MCM0080572.1 hypothetical protein [Geomonas sp. Red32]
MENMGTNLFVFEGPDGVGKTSISKMFSSYLKSIGVACSYYSFPGDCSGTLGKHVYDIHHQMGDAGITTINPTSLQLLHVASHIDAIESDILPALRSGQTIVLDRFWWSTAIYGSVFGANPESLRKMVEIEEMHWGDHHPMCVFYLKRRSTLEPSPMAHWGKLVEAYDCLVGREVTRTRIEVINNDKSPEAALKRILEVYKRLAKESHD